MQHVYWLALLLVFFIPFSAFALEKPFTSAEIVALGNVVREVQGLSPLAVNPQLAAAAEARVHEMAESGYFAHRTKGGGTPWGVVRAKGYRFSRIAENLAVRYESAPEVVAGWVASPGHRKNLTNPAFTEVGVAVARGIYKGHDALFVVQIIATPSFD